MKIFIVGTITILHFRVVVIATGMWLPNIPDIPGIDYAEGYETVSINPEDYEGKNVLILGKKILHYSVKMVQIVKKNVFVLIAFVYCYLEM